jgi:antitoxin YefM
MSTIPLTEAQFKLPDLIDEVSRSNKPIKISGQVHNAVLISEDNWRGIQETIYLGTCE